ncbi:pyridoxamine 5'-phosphate oxidase family protein [uncultured Croceitalea sp.]|uniref:pyridoxamine 5'-phosphate oxidase family protein n=1 Tax=uncultured Croceitalea sp. TaxID=1798908 RepID=UPI0033065C86
MVEGIFKELKTELLNGYSKKGHPFRYFTLATSDETNAPQQRTVVLRKITPKLELLFYTDKRSSKVQQLLKNDAVSALFYHPKQLLQLKVDGKAEIVNDEKIIASLWSEIPLKSKKDYTTQNAPGSLIQNPDEVDYLNEENHFCIVQIIPRQIEYLQLKSPNHLRVLFKEENGQWKGSFLVP